MYGVCIGSTTSTRRLRDLSSVGKFAEAKPRLNFPMEDKPRVDVVDPASTTDIPYF